MFKNIFKTLIINVLCLMANNLLAQKNITGKVFDNESQEPIVGATITDATKTKGTLTDANGFFSFETDATDITISSIGYETIQVKTGDKLTIALPPSVQNLQNLIVTANREAAQRTTAPMAISKLSTKLIDETKATGLVEIVNKTPGVLMVNLGNEQHSMSIRQPMTTNAYYLYMEDGVPIRPLGVFNHNALLEVNQFTVSSIEVVKGPVSSIYGAEAVGGAINLIGQRPTAVPTAKIGIQADQFGYRRLQFGSGMMLGKKLGFYVGGIISQQKEGWITSSDYDKTNLNARFEYHFSPKTRLVSSTTYGTYNSQTSGSVDSVAFYARQYVSTTDFTYRKSDAVRSNLRLEHDWANGGQTFINAFYRWNAHGQNPSYGIRWTTGAVTARGEINSNDFKSLGFIAQHTQKFKFLASKLIVGATIDESPNTYWSYQIDLNAQLRADKKSVEKYTIAKERPDIQLANYEAQIHNRGAYLQYDFKPFDRLRVSVGARHDRMAFDYTNYLDTTSGSKLYTQTTPKIGLTYEITEGVGAYANYSKGFSPPSLTAIFRKRPVPTASGEKFYYNLEPALFDNAEIGGWVSLWQNKIYLDIAAYQMNGTNELLNIRQPDNSFDYQSAGKTLHKGIELGLTVKPTDEFFFRFGGTYAIHRYVEFTLSQRASDAIKNVNGFDMPSSPRFTWNTELNYYPKWLKGLRTSVEWQHVDGWYQNQINTVRYEGYNLVNVRVGYKWRWLEVFGNVMNATDALFAYNATRGNAATDRTTFTPAAPRNFVLGVQYNFVGKK
jgi:iron complex outermembrane recepter protein